MSIFSAGRPPTRIWFSGYLPVLALIIASYWFTAAQTTSEPSPMALIIQLIAVAAVFHAARLRQSIQRVTWVFLGASLLAIVVILVLDSTDGRSLNIVLAAAAAIAYLVAPLTIFVAESRRDRVDGETLLAAICAYILIGMFFTYFYNIVALWQDSSIFGSDTPDGLTSLLFFSFTTLTTTGYGNLVPVGAGVQSLAISEAITGQLFLVTAVARVMTAWKPPRG